MGDFVDAHASDESDARDASDADERDMLLDILDSLEHEPSEEVALVAARLARRYLDNIDDLSEAETASLIAAANADDARGSAWTCSRAHEGMLSLWLRVRERDPRFPEFRSRLPNSRFMVTTS